MQKFSHIKLNHEIPIIAAAIHNGHLLSEELEHLTALSAAERLREEDPFTGGWAEISSNKIIANFSRFEVDLNRPPDKSVYLVPEDAWGLDLWHSGPPEELVTQTRLKYAEFYESVRSSINHLLEQHDKIVIYDLHSYNHRRQGPEQPPADPELNPEVNIGTGTMDRKFWDPIVNRFLADMRIYNYFGRSLDVRENIKFKGGYFSRWIHENFPKQVCCLSIEFKKFFMDEWSGEPDRAQLTEIKSLLKFTTTGVLEELEK